MSTLALHNPKFDAKLTTLDALRTLPAPVAMGTYHKPVPHATLVDAIHGEIDKRGYQVGREQLALAAKRNALFGVIDLAPKAAIAEGMLRTGERGLSFGFRNATDQSLALRAVAGSRVFVCDNLALSGSMFAMERKNTTGLDLGDAVARGFDKFLAHAEVLEIEITKLSAKVLTDGAAKQIVFDVFAARIIPVRLFDDVEQFYFHPADDMLDCQPRTAWGLHNAFTRAMKDLSPVRGFGANVALGNFFGLQSEQ